MAYSAHCATRCVSDHSVVSANTGHPPCNGADQVRTEESVQRNCSLHSLARQTADSESASLAVTGE